VGTFKQASFVNSFSAFDPKKLEGFPEVALVGRSNVGKSSLINMITGQSKLAKISASPGKTRLINYFLVDRQIYLVDLPGYGFAQAPKSEIKRWGEMIESYLLSSENLRLVLVLVDIRHRPTADDKMMVDWLKSYDIPYKIVATKADKLSKAQIRKSLMDIGFDLKTDMLSDIIVTSSSKRIGADDVIRAVRSCCQEN